MSVCIPVAFLVGMNNCHFLVLKVDDFILLANSVFIIRQRILQVVVSCSGICLHVKASS